MSYQREVKKRLMAYNTIKAIIERDKMDVEDLMSEGSAGRVTDIVLKKLASIGKYVPPEDIQQHRINKLLGRICQCEGEIREIDRAVALIDDDPYDGIIQMKYFKGWTEQKIATELYCDKSTVYRRLSKQLDQLVILLYGAAGIN